MKIRIKGDSVRIRLSKTEVDTFGKEGFYAEKTRFPNGEFQYGVVTRHDIASLQAEFTEKGIFLLMPQHMADEWVATQRVGFETTMPLKEGNGLFLLIEKDFVCLDNTAEDQSDMYPNPLSEFHK